VPACVVAVGCLGFAAILRVQTPRVDTTTVRVGERTYEMPGIVSYDEVQRRYPNNYAYMSYPRQDALHNAQGLALGGLALFVLGSIWWAFWAGVGWVAAGFQREAQP
jgi:hypothetical protein